MLELLKFILDSPANFFGSIFILTYLYALFGSAGLNVVKEFFAFKTASAESKLTLEREQLAVRKLEVERDVARIMGRTK